MKVLVAEQIAASGDDLLKQKFEVDVKTDLTPEELVAQIGAYVRATRNIMDFGADFTFGKPVSIQSTFPLLDPMTETVNCISADGLEMYFESGRAGGRGGEFLSPPTAHRPPASDPRASPQ